MKPTLLIISLLISIYSQAQISITLKYKRSKCGGAKNQDTTSYFLLANKKWIIQYPSKKIDTIVTDIQGKIKLPAQKGTYLLFEPWKFYHTAPSDFPMSLYDKNCLSSSYSTPDFTIQITSNRKYKISPSYYYIPCPDKHPCLRKDTIIPRIPSH